ncbi:MAG TPA: MraY family glycosyltransferase [Terriglobales bacterium]|nr:MraY family glycosyltransferase [Terriglobales bacterium]
MDVAYLSLFGGALVCSSVLTHYIRNTAMRWGWTSRSAGERDIHSNPVPRLGGVAIFLSFLLVLAGFAIFKELHGSAAHLPARTVLAILLPATLIFCLGLVDDFHPLSPRVKFGVQIIAALMLFAGGLQIDVVPLLFGYKSLGALITLPLTVLWVLWISNAFNLIDGLDGLSAGSAMFSTLVVFVVSLFSNNSLVSVLTVILSGAILGFLRYNFNPATIFLGDCGSLFLGFMLSAIALAGAQKGTTLVAVAIPIVSFGLPILDVALSVIRRFLSGQPLFRADREHIHHRLLKLGFSQRQVVTILYAVSALLGLLSLLMLYPNGSSVGVVLTVVGVGVWFGIQHLGYHEFVEVGRVAKRATQQKRVIVNNLAIRRAAEDLASAGSLPRICQILEVAFRDNEFDGFDLRIRPGQARQMPRDFFQIYESEWLFSWDKSGDHPFHREGGRMWRLSLDLGVLHKGPVGSLCLYRAYSQKSLLVDINLLTSDFCATLSQAVKRGLQDVIAEEERVARDELTGSSRFYSVPGD